jgi:hypothetical protein
MTYKEGQAVLYKPLNVIGYIRRVNNRPEVSETQRNYQVEVNGYLVTVYCDQEDTYLWFAPPKPNPPVRKPGILAGLNLPKWLGGKEHAPVAGQ